VSLNEKDSLLHAEAWIKLPVSVAYRAFTHHISPGTMKWASATLLAKSQRMHRKVSLFPLGDKSKVDNRLGTSCQKKKPGAKPAGSTHGLVEDGIESSNQGE